MITANASGRLAFDAREINTRSGKPMTQARMACQDGDSPTLWIDLVAFGDNAAWLARCAKGDRVSAIGTLKLNRWTGKDGAEKECLQLVVDNMLCNAPKPKNAKKPSQPKPKSQAVSDPFAGGEDDGMLPF